MSSSTLERIPPESLDSIGEQQLIRKSTNDDVRGEGEQNHNLTNNDSNPQSSSTSFSLEAFLSGLDQSQIALLASTADDVEVSGRVEAQKEVPGKEADVEDQTTFDLKSMNKWLEMVSPDWKVAQLQELVKYVFNLSHSGQPPSTASKVISSAMCRICTCVSQRDESASDYVPVLRFAYISCFKALMYLELYDIPFDVDTIVKMIEWQIAYQSISMLCFQYQLRFNAEVHGKVHTLSRQVPNIINNSITKIIVMDLKNIAKQKGPWATSSRVDNSKLYGIHLQDTDLIVDAKEFAKNGTVDFSDLDNRIPNTPYDVEQELITVIMSAVSAVDKQFGIERDMSEWTDLREFLTAYGVCDHDGDMYGNYSITHTEETYGTMVFSPFDLFTPIGYNMLNVHCPENETIIVSNESTRPKSVSHLDNYTIQVEYENGTEELLGFFGDVSFAKLTMGIVHIAGSDTLYIEYKNPTSTEEREYNTMSVTTMEIAKKILAEEITSSYPSPNGIQSIGFCLTRPWKNWRGVSIAEGPVSVVAMNALKDYIELNSSPPEGDHIAWDGYMIDFEVIALARRIQRKPSSNVLLAYLSHVCTHPKFQWKHSSSCVPFEKGQRNTFACFTEDDVERFITSNKQKSVKAMSKGTELHSREGFIVVKCGRPWDLLIIFIFLLIICVAPAISRPKWNDSMTEAVQNLGTGMTPLLFLYALVRYKGWDLDDMIRGYQKCSTLEEAETKSGVSKEKLAMTAKKNGLARDIFHTRSNSVALTGAEGFGNTSSSGLRCHKLMDTGSVFISKQGEEIVIGMIDAGGYLMLEKDTASDKWIAKQENLEPGILKILSKNEIENIVIC